MKRILCSIFLLAALSALAGITTNYVDHVDMVPTVVLKTNVEVTFNTDDSGNLSSKTNVQIGKVFDQIQITNKLPVYENTETHVRWFGTPTAATNAP